MSIAKAIPAERGCGERKSGGVYAEMGCGPDGLPLEHFIVDPPIVIDPAALGLSPIGVQLVERDGVWHILDWIGSEHYPNVADFLEEVRRFGLSRRLAKTVDFSKLTERSKILVVHARAHVENFRTYADHWLGVRYNRCPKELSAHNIPDAPDSCAGVWWEDVEGGSPPRPTTSTQRVVIRIMPAFNYVAASRPDGVTPRYRPAVFASFPITRLVVIRGEHDEHEPGQQAASRSTLPVELEDQ
jgi:hypothetical protein